MSGEYVTQIVKGKAGWSALLPELEELSASAESFNPYFSPEWLDSWSSHVGIAYNPVLLTVREQDGQLSGFWPFVETPAIFGTGLWPMGYHASDYLDPLARKTDPLLLITLVKGLGRLLEEYRFIWLPLLRKAFAQDIFRPFFARCRQPMLFEPGATRHTIELADRKFDELIESSLGPKTRKTLRYTRRKLEGKGSLEITSVASEAEVRDALSQFEQVEDGSWKASKGTGLFHHLGMREFYLGLLPKLASRGSLHLRFLKLDGKAIACEIAFEIGGHYCLHNTSFVNGFDECSPGRHLLLDSIEQSTERGLELFDFMQGHQEYKQRLGTHSEPIYTVSLFQKSFLGKLNKFVIGGIQKRRAVAHSKKSEDEDL